MNEAHLDVLIVGAGLSGICAARYLETAFPERRYAILEARDRLGGTWDLFRYPGIRSDSDMYTLGFSFRPWRNPKAIADGPSILSYLQETAEDLGISEHIRYNRRVVKASWSSADQRWTVTVRGPDGAEEALTCSFLWCCTGYYRYDQGYTPDFPGLERFAGPVIHPQHWPEDLDVAGKKVVVIGSGATAVTLVPELAKAGAQVTMLQRSPTYIVSMPSVDAWAERVKRRLPQRQAHRFVRTKNILVATSFYQFCQRFPGAARKVILRRVRAAVGDAVPDLEQHFTPSYDPWDQRLCLVPDGDLFQVLREGKVSLITDHIEAFTPSGVALRSGRTVEADVIVTATGLQLQFMGGAALELDGERVEIGKLRMYKGAMLSDVPNAAFILGYTNASWTLKAELVCQWVTRVLRHMDQRGFGVCVPRRVDPTVQDEPVLDLSAGYVLRALHELPTQGSKPPWKLYQNYILDRRLYRRQPIDDGTLQFEPRRAAATDMRNVVQATG